jgi:hypothetical protein
MYAAVPVLPAGTGTTCWYRYVYECVGTSFVEIIWNVLDNQGTFTVSENKNKRTTLWIPTWSPTVVLTQPEHA